MATPEESAFDLVSTFVHLEDGGHAKPVAVTDTFWPELMAGRRRYDGRLVTAFQVRDDAPHWEMHPAGDELIVLVSGAVDFVLEGAGGERTLALCSRSPCCIIPKGVWHRFVVHSPGKLLFITPGEGTGHRPL